MSLVSGCLSGGFEFDVWDGNTVGSRQEFRVKVNQLELRESINRDLVVFPGTFTPISAQDLTVETTDNHSQEYHTSKQIRSRSSLFLLRFIRSYMQRLCIFYT